jgi:membrane protein
MVISIGVITVLFAAIYKFLPDAKIRWRDVWVGAFVTALLFVVAKYALGLYFGKSDPGSTYGAAGSIVLIMLWVSYTGMILLFGAEFTQVYANRYGTKVKPTEGAVSTSSGQNTPRPQPASGPSKSKQREKDAPMQQRTFKGSPWLRTR